MSEPILDLPGGVRGAALDAMREKLQRRRKMTNAMALTASLGAIRRPRRTPRAAVSRTRSSAA